MKTELLEKLRALNITDVIVDYSGSGDDGYINDITTLPTEIDRELSNTLEDFFWDCVIQMHHEGFHNDDGGYGEVKWDIATDKMVLHHRDYVMKEFDYGEKFVEVED